MDFVSLVIDYKQLHVCYIFRFTYFLNFRLPFRNIDGSADDLGIYNYILQASISFPFFASVCEASVFLHGKCMPYNHAVN